VSLNKAMIIGNLGRDPEMRYTPTGQAVTQFTVAVNRNYRGQDGNWQEETEWFRVVAWGPLAERTAENLRKGRKVYVEGRIQTRQWEDKDGQKRYTTELVANQVTSLDRGQRDEGDPGPGDTATGGKADVSPVRGARQAGAGGGAGASAGASAGAATGAGSGEETYEDLDDLPF
jgi:single-strand DNA-binding protein